MFPALRTKTTLAQTERNTTCRRVTRRQKLRPTSVTCWSIYDAPAKAAVIEADVKGARVMLPWNVMPGETISISLGNEVGLFQTRTAQVVWTQPLEVTGKVVAGIAFDYEASAQEFATAC